jgi:hypothetical protein
MEIGLDSIGIHAADMPENVVVMQIGVSRFGDGGLCRIGYVVPRAARKMVRALAVASEYLASPEATQDMLWELRGQPTVPSAVRSAVVISRDTSAARLVLNLALLVVTVPMVAVRFAVVAARALRTFMRRTRAWLVREFSDQPDLLVITGVATAIAVYLLR